MEGVTVGPERQRARGESGPIVKIVEHFLTSCLKQRFLRPFPKTPNPPPPIQQVRGQHLALPAASRPLLQPLGPRPF